MGDRFDEMATRVSMDIALLGITRRENEIAPCIATALRTVWNEAIEAAAQHFYKSSRDGCGREIRALKEPKR